MGRPILATNLQHAGALLLSLLGFEGCTVHTAATRVHNLLTHHLKGLKLGMNHVKFALRDLEHLCSLIVKGN